EGKKDFVFLNGDIFDNQQTEQQIIDHLLNPVSDLFATSIPFIFGRGNHELWGPYARQLDHYFDGGAQKFYYTFYHGPLCGIVLDSGDTQPDDAAISKGVVEFDSYRERQGEWLAKEVQKPEFKSSKFKVAFVHVPPFYSKKELHAAVHYNKIWG